jgi:AraC-like DNA-binding protein
MPDSVHLSLQLIRLNPTEQWVNQGKDLCFIFPRGGVGRYVSGSVDRRLHPGDVLVASQSSAGHLSVHDKTELAFWCFSLSLEHLYPLFAAPEISILQAVTEALRPCKIYPASMPLAGECHRLLREVPPQFDLDHRAQLLRVAGAILAPEFKNVRHHRVAGYIRPDEHLIQVFERLSVNEMLGLSVNELAGKFGCSRRHLNRLFHQHFGLSIAGLRMEMRLLKAVSLLRDPHAKIINVAEQCGFNHLGLFNTCFKRRFGTSPGQWRKAAASLDDRAKSLDQEGSVCPLRIIGLCPWNGGSESTPASHGKRSARGSDPGAQRASQAGRRTAAPGPCDEATACDPSALLTNSGITFRIRP